MEHSHSSLLEKISTPKYLRRAFDLLNKSNEHSHGVDKLSLRTFKENLDSRIEAISLALQKGKYRFSKNRGALIPKTDDDFRPLQIPIISDRIVLKAIALELEELLQPDISSSKDVSFAYQKGRGVRDAVQRIKAHFDNGNNYVLQADIIKFFDRIDREVLLEEQVFPKLPDNSLNDLIFNGLSQELCLDEIKDEHLHYFEELGNGVPQGNPLSPLLSNVYLAPFDTELKSQSLNLVRYADDFVILCNSYDECKRAFELSKAALKKLALEIHDLEKRKKTNIINLNEDGAYIEFLSIVFNGHKLYPSRKNIDRFKNKIRVICRGTPSHDVLALLDKVKYTLDGWVSAFYYTQMEDFYKEIDSFINRHLYLALYDLGWKFTAKAKGKLPKRYRKAEKSPDCLSIKQRRNSGIPFCQELVNMKRASSEERNKPKD